MGTMIAGLLRLQSIEHQLADVRGRLRTRENAVTVQQQRIDQHQSDFDALHEKSLTRRKDADRLELDLNAKEAQVTRLRSALNTARTNKEYASILTQVNTHKADNAKLEEQILRILQEVDAIGVEIDQIRQKITEAESHMAKVKKLSASEIEKLNAMRDELTSRRTEAVKDVPAEALGIFERIAENYDGDAMAVIEVHGRRPPHEYVCGGCFMGLNAEHANALRVRDEIRCCYNCGRILYLEPQAKASSEN